MIVQRLDNIIAVGLLVAIGFTALAHGAVEPWSMAIFELLVILLTFLSAIKCTIKKGIDIRLPAAFGPILAFLIYGVVQSVALEGPSGKISSLSSDVEATRNVVIVLFGLLISYLIAANFFDTEKRWQMLIKFLIVFGFVLSLLSLIQYFTRENIFHWSKPTWAVSQWLSGPFVNHNHFAGYMELIIPIPIALIITGAVKQARLLYGFAAVVMAIAVIFSVSRGGMMGLASGLLFLSLGGIRYFRSSGQINEFANDDPKRSFRTSSLRNAIPIAVIVFAIFAGVAWFGMDAVIGRISDNDFLGSGEKVQTFEGSRGWIWKNSFTVFQSNPIYGTGMGTFETVFPQYSEGYRAMYNGNSYIWSRAHNDYLQVLTDTGLIGGILALWFLLTIIISMRRGIYLTDPFRAGLALGTGAAILSLLVHSVVDFNLQLPSTSLLFLILTAILANVTDVPDKSSRTSEIPS